MRLNTEPYSIQYRNDTEVWHLAGPGITEELTRSSRYEAEQLAKCMAIAYKVGKKTNNNRGKLFRYGLIVEKLARENQGHSGPCTNNGMCARCSAIEEA